LGINPDAKLKTPEWKIFVNMTKSEIFKQVRADVKAGKDRKQVFETYKNQIAKPLHLAMVITCVAYPERKKQNEFLNLSLIALLIVSAVLKALGAAIMFSQYGIGPSIGMSLLSILVPALCAVEVARWNGQIYFVLPIFCVAAYLQILTHWEEGWPLLIDFALTTAILALSVTIWKKVFPTLKFGGIKKDLQGEFIF